jgi:hypothetical protein
VQSTENKSVDAPSLESLIRMTDWHIQNWERRMPRATYLMRQMSDALAAERDRADRGEARLALIRRGYDQWDGNNDTVHPLLSAVEIALAPNMSEATA